MKFKINGKQWEIIKHNTKRLSQIVSDIEKRECNFAYGYTYYPTQKILINKDLCVEQQTFTLKHELAHCYIWNYGLYHVNYEEEILCDIVASSNDFINEVVNKYLKIKE